MARPGLTMAIGATLLWIPVVWAILLTPRSYGVPIGVGSLYILAVPLSVVAASTLICTLVTTSRARAAASDARRPALQWSAAALAAVSAALLVVTFVLGSPDSATRDVLRGLLFSGVGTFVVATAFVAMPAKRSR